MHLAQFHAQHTFYSISIIHIRKEASLVALGRNFTSITLRSYFSGQWQGIQLVLHRKCYLNGIIIFT